MNISGLLQMPLPQRTLSVPSSTKALQSQFIGYLRQTTVTEETSVADYTDHLRAKYGNVRIENIGRDQKSLDQAAGTMRGGDVIIAPNMLEKMAAEPETAKRIEGYIDSVFENIPKWTAEFAAKDLTFESLGVIVHEDGTVTHICGCADSPERCAEVDRINREKREKEAAQRKRMYEESLEASLKRNRIYEKQRLESVRIDRDLSVVSSATGAYERMLLIDTNRISGINFSALSAEK